MIDAWILRTTDYKESSKLVVAMGAQGVFSFVAKGMRQYKSPWRSVIAPFHHVHLTLSKGTLPALQAAELASSVDEAMAELPVISYLEHIAELFYTLRDTIAFETLYPYWLHLLPVFATDPEGYGMMMEIKLLYVMGITPVFDRCVICNNTVRTGFSIAEGGMVCQAHQTPETIIDSDVVVGLYQLYQHDIQASFPPMDRGKIRRLIDAYYAYHVNVQTTARQLIRTIYTY
jgi:DNA repair protein RecO